MSPKFSNLHIALRMNFRYIIVFVTLYIDDLYNVSNALDFIFFAQDTSIFSLVTIQINWWKLWITSWRNYQAGFRLISFLLTLKKKSNFIRFKTKQNRQKLDFHFPINDIEIDRVNKVLFLRVILDEHLSWKSQTQNVARKVSKSVVIINKSGFCLDKTYLCTLCYN